MFIPTVEAGDEERTIWKNHYRNQMSIIYKTLKEQIKIMGWRLPAWKEKIMCEYCDKEYNNRPLLETELGEGGSVYLEPPKMILDLKNARIGRLIERCPVCGRSFEEASQSVDKTSITRNSWELTQQVCSCLSDESGGKNIDQAESELYTEVSQLPGDSAIRHALQSLCDHIKDMEGRTGPVSGGYFNLEAIKEKILTAMADHPVTVRELSGMFPNRYTGIELQGCTNKGWNVRWPVGEESIDWKKLPNVIMDEVISDVVLVNGLLRIDIKNQEETNE